MLKEYARIIGAICFLACNALSAWVGYNWADSGWSLRWAERDVAESAARLHASELALTRQKKLLQELDNAYKEQKSLKEKHDRNIADSRAAADRLRVELDRIKALPKITDSSSIAERAAAATDRVVLAELLGVSDLRAGEYAQYADEHRAALIACRAEYEVIRANN